MPLKSWRVWGIAIVVALSVGSLGFVPKGYASSTFSVADKQAGYTAPEANATTAGSNMVWLGRDTEGWTQIFGRDLESGDLKQLTTTKSYKERVSAGGDYVVYLENQQNIMLLNLQTGETSKAEIKPLPYEDLRTDGHYVIYHQVLEQMIYAYDMETKEVKQVGKGDDATIVDGVVVYSSRPDSDIMLYDMRSGKSRELVNQGSTYSDDQMAFNGKNVVWTQVSLDKVQTRILNVEEMDPLPQVLNIYKGPPVIPNRIHIGKSIAAWQAPGEGNDQIVVAADLASRQTDTVADKGEKLIGLYRDQLVLKDKDNKVLLRSLQLTGQGKVITDTLVSAIPPIDNDKQPDATSGFMGGESPGSIMKLASSDNSVLISNDNPNPYERLGGSNISIYYQKDDDLVLTKALQPGQKFVSHPWSLGIGWPVTPFKLSMSYIAKRVPAGQEGKIGIYYLDSGKWKYMGGIFEQNNQRLYTQMTQSGVYAVLYEDVPNRLIRDYYLDNTIRTINASKPIRIFLDGEELTFHEQPVLKDGSTTVEFRPIFEKLGLQIDWNGDTQTVTGTKEGQSLKLTLGQSNAVLNGSSAELPVAAFLNQGYTFVPLRFVGEATGRKVLWDPNLKAVYIYDPATEGKLFYNGSLLYEGQLKDGKMNGKGKLFREDGTLWYDAEFRDNEVIGLGTIYYSGFMGVFDRTGDVTIGPFKHGFPDGDVVSINANGDIDYQGQEVQGFRTGKGKLFDMGQLIYEGEFKAGLFDGYGKYYRDGKLVYEGYFVKGVQTANGTK